MTIILLALAVALGGIINIEAIRENGWEPVPFAAIYYLGMCTIFYVLSNST